MLSAFDIRYVDVTYAIQCAEALIVSGIFGGE